MMTSKIPGNLVELLQSLKLKGVSEKDFFTYIDSFLEYKAREAFVPLHGHFELTPLCNLDCKMCYVHLSKDQMKGKSLLSVETWKSLISQAHRMGMIKASLTGGECLMYPGFKEIYSFLIEMGVTVNILTNAVLLNDDLIDFFLKHPPRHIQISLYGSSDEAYERVTGHKVYGRVIENVIKAKRAGLPIGIVITPNRWMLEDAKDLLSLVYSLGVPYNINSSLITPRDETGRRIEDISIDQYVELYRIKKFLECAEPYSPCEDVLPQVNEYGRRSTGIKCAAGRSSFSVSWNGMVCACASLPDLAEDGLTSSFPEAWKKINQKAMNYPVPSECEGCVYQSVCVQCVAVHNIIHNPGHCNPRVCEKTKQYIRQGIISLPKIT